MSAPIRVRALPGGYWGVTACARKVSASEFFEAVFRDPDDPAKRVAALTDEELAEQYDRAFHGERTPIPLAYLLGAMMTRPGASRLFAAMSEGRRNRRFNIPLTDVREIAPGRVAG